MHDFDRYQDGTMELQLQAITCNLIVHCAYLYGGGLIGI